MELFQSPTAEPIIVVPSVATNTIPSVATNTAHPVAWSGVAQPSVAVPAHMAPYAMVMRSVAPLAAPAVQAIAVPSIVPAVPSFAAPRAAEIPGSRAIVQANNRAMMPPPLPQPTFVQQSPQQPQRFHTPQGHYVSPVENIFAATNILARLAPAENTQMDREARRAVEMLSTAVVHQANMSEHAGRLHSTPYNSRATAERSIHVESPHVATSSSARRQRENQPVAQNQPHQVNPQKSYSRAQ